MIEISGEYTTAKVMVSDESLVEESALEQIQRFVDTPAFTEQVRIMADTHKGAGAPIGFSMPLGDKVVPNVVGVDVGCGMLVVVLGAGDLPLSHEEREQAVRDAVPMGFNVHSYDEAPHLVNEFPFDRANDRFDQFNAAFEDKFGEPLDPLEFEFTGYDEAYFKSLCARVLQDTSQDMNHIIKSAGTLGGGNHFIEFAEGRTSGRNHLVIHSGSRYLGKSVAEYWQRKAITHRDDTGERVREYLTQYPSRYFTFDIDAVSDAELLTWVTGGNGQWKDMETIRDEFKETNPDRINELHGELAEASHIAQEGQNVNVDDSLDYLEGREAHGYYIDMLFAQQYARWNRDLMANAICETLGVTPDDRWHSTHNYIDFRDMIIRKGATPAREGQRLIIPFNMAEGSIIAVGKGNEEYNQTAPHGAGRTMSRRQAKEEVTLDEFTEAMEGVYSESIVDDVRDEAPQVYKSAAAIADEIEPTASIEEWLDVVHNLKAQN